jgi:hypothetical protein
MKAEDLIKVLRKMIKEEVQKAVAQEVNKSMAHILAEVIGSRDHNRRLNERTELTEARVPDSRPQRNFAKDKRLNDVLNAIKLIDPNTPEIGFTGGEPTLVGDHFFQLVEAAKNYLPRTALHILSNGRNFSKMAINIRWKYILTETPKEPGFTGLKTEIKEVS